MGIFKNDEYIPLSNCVATRFARADTAALRQIQYHYFPVADMPRASAGDNRVDRCLEKIVVDGNL